MALTQTLNLQVPQPGCTVDVEIVIPVYNEEKALVRSVSRLQRYLTETFPVSWVITVADNASTDGTWGIACRLVREFDGVRAVRIAQKGRGRALRTVWGASQAAVVAYMDVDMSTDLDALLPLVAPLLSGHSDVAIGSRLAAGARVVRGPKREVISRLYNLLLRSTLHNSFSDAQCGFKAVRTDVANQLLPLVEDNGWFFDTELLVLAERNGLRVYEVPVDWVDDPDSRVDVVATARDDLKGVLRLLAGFARGKGGLTGPASGTFGSKRRPQPGPAGRVAHLAGIGAVSTLAFALLFALLYGQLGAVGADLVALVFCSTGNLAANRRYTFRSRGPVGRGRYYARGVGLALLPVASTLGGLALISALGAGGLVLDLVVLTLANLSSSAVRWKSLFPGR
jgi:putative flippase GtrA